MADALNSKIAQTFQRYVESCCAAGQALTEEAKKEITDKGVIALLKDCCSDEVVKACEANVFSKYCDKATKKLKVDVFNGEFLAELAATIIQAKQKLDKLPDHTSPEVVALIKELKEQIAAKADAKPAAVKSAQKTSCCRS